MKQTTGKTALVTGAARRVGRAIALRLAEAGFDIVLTYHRSEADAQAVCGEIHALGRQATAISADLTQVPQGVETIVRRVERVDVLVNNASIYEPDPADSSWHGLPARDSGEQPPTPRSTAAHGPEAGATGVGRGPTELFRRLMAIHVETPLLLCRALAPSLRQSRGHVINMLDMMAERPWPKYAAYCASKAALLNLTLSLARELAPEVTVNGIAPGVVQWPDGFAEEDRRAYLARVPLARAGDAQDVANLVHFLVTQGTYITGQIIRLDGGRSLT